jgi:hypothetical protein
LLLRVQRETRRLLLPRLLTLLLAGWSHRGWSWRCAWR